MTTVLVKGNVWYFLCLVSLIVTFSWTPKPEFMIRHSQEHFHTHTQKDSAAGRVWPTFWEKLHLWEVLIFVSYPSSPRKRWQPLIRFAWYSFSQKLFIKYLLTVCFHTSDDFVNTDLSLQSEYAVLPTAHLEASFKLGSFGVSSACRRFPCSTDPFPTEAANALRLSWEAERLSMWTVQSFVSLACVPWIYPCKDACCDWYA